MKVNLRVNKYITFLLISTFSLVFFNGCASSHIWEKDNFFYAKNKDEKSLYSDVRNYCKNQNQYIAIFNKKSNYFGSFSSHQLLFRCVKTIRYDDSKNYNRDNNIFKSTQTKYDKFGYTIDGYNKAGYNKAGYNKVGYNKEGKKVNVDEGYSRDGLIFYYPKSTKDCTLRKMIPFKAANGTLMCKYKY
jgi:hypothetical protein